MIEKILHQIWVGDFKLPAREKGLIENIKALHPDYEHKLWTSPEGLPDNVQYWYDKFYSIKNYAFCADVMRIWVVYKYGGFYLDVDFDIKKRLDPFFEGEGVFFYHNSTDFTIPNNIFAAKSGCKVLEYCVNSVTPECSWYGPSWMGETIKRFLGLEYNSPQDKVKTALFEIGVDYSVYWDFEKSYGKHLSLYSWSPEIWNKLNNNEQL